MRVRCPKCEETFNAKVNARRLKCPSCGFREDAPEGGFGEALATGRKRPDGFIAVTPPRPEQKTPTALVVVGVVVLLVAAGAAAWMLTRGGDGATADGRLVTVVTGEGNFTLELYPEQAPKTVANFLAYVDEGYYTDLVFHRVVQGPIWVIQGGGVRADGSPKPPTRAPVANEAASSGLRNTAYTISMARTDDPDSATTQFFVNTRDNPSLDPSPGNPGYAVFGKVVAGRDVVDRIQMAPVNGDQPVDPVPLVAMRRGSGTAPSTSAPPGTATSAPPGQSSTCESAPASEPVPATGPLDLDLITPGHWNLCGEPERMLVWAHNRGEAPVRLTWNVTGPGGTPLPAGWRVVFEPPMASLEPDRGTSSAAPYPDWANSLATLVVPPGTPPGDYPAELRAAGAVQPFVFHLRDTRERLTQPGDHANTFYDLRLEDGTKFQEGPYCLQVAAPGSVTGYAFGTAGVALGETVTLVVPEPLAYGFSGGQLSGQRLTWLARIDGFPPDCPRPG